MTRLRCSSFLAESLAYDSASSKHKKAKGGNLPHMAAFKERSRPASSCASVLPLSSESFECSALLKAVCCFLCLYLLMTVPCQLKTLLTLVLRRPKEVACLELFGAILEPILEPSWPAWAILGSSGPSWGYLGAVLGYLGPSWAILGASWDQERFRNHRPKITVPRFKDLDQF